MIEVSEILYRWTKGFKIKAIAGSLGYARNTVIVRRAERIKPGGEEVGPEFESIIKTVYEEMYSKNEVCGKNERTSKLAEYTIKR